MNGQAESGKKAKSRARVSSLKKDKGKRIRDKPGTRCS
jgi:hypothetical protein